MTDFLKQFEATNWMDTPMPTQPITPQPEFIERVSGITPAETVMVYPYGSRVYGTATASSDYDFILVFKGDKKDQDAQQYESYMGGLSFTAYHVDTWKEHIENHKIFALECDSIKPLVGFPFKLDLPTLRKEISAKASNSWVKCKKKLEVEGDIYIGYKSLFHSFRIPIFGIQIAKYGKIVDFTAANSIWDEMLTKYYAGVMWDELKAEYQPRHNELMTEFRKLAEKK